MEGGREEWEEGGGFLVDLSPTGFLFLNFRYFLICFFLSGNLFFLIYFSISIFIFFFSCHDHDEGRKHEPFEVEENRRKGS